MTEPHSANESLLDYLDELLQETAAPDVNPPAAETENGNGLPASNSAPARVPVKQPGTPVEAVAKAPQTASPQVGPQRKQTAVKPQALAELEQLKREKLQALLNQQVAKAPQKTRPQVDTGIQTKTDTSASAPQSNEQALLREKIGPLAETEITQDSFSTGVNSVLEWAENGRPQWAQSRFDVLLFDVSGLTLAVPLIALGQIQAIGEDLTPIFGQSDWFMGLLNSPLGQIKTVNTALFVMPEKYSDNFLDSAKYVISIDGLSWGLAVDSVNQPITLDPADVKWRSQRTTRPWLAGTVKSAMCALIDIPRMASLLTDSEKRR